MPLGSICELKINNYVDNIRNLKKIKKNSNDIVFLNRNGGKLSRAMIFNIVKEAQRKSNIKKTISPHTLRHTFGTHLLDNDADIRSIQELLGHNSISSTQIYTKVNPEKMKKIYESAHPHAS